MDRRHPWIADSPHAAGKMFGAVYDGTAPDTNGDDSGWVNGAGEGEEARFGRPVALALQVQLELSGHGVQSPGLEDHNARRCLVVSEASFDGEGAGSLYIPARILSGILPEALL